MGFLKNGKKTEKLFSKILKNVHFSNESQDIKEHWDLSTEIKFDVKGLKKRKRSDDFKDQSIHWIEIKNVNGDKGWLYGDADFFVFEIEDYWIIVDKDDLQDYVANNTIKEYTIVPTVNRLYKRKGRKDVLTLISTFDLIYISVAYIRKQPIS